jgi:hypothetical protein
MLFYKDNCVRLKQSHPNLKVGDYGKLNAIDWELLDADKKQKYQEIADKDLIRYNNEKE